MSFETKYGMFWRRNIHKISLMFCDFSSNTEYSFFFACHKTGKNGWGLQRFVTCASHILRFKKCLIASNARFNLQCYVLNILGCSSGRKKKIRSPQKLIIGYTVFSRINNIYFINEYLHFSVPLYGIISVGAWSS